MINPRNHKVHASAPGIWVDGEGNTHLERKPDPTYTLSAGGDAITCRQCGLTSHNPSDVQFHYCGKCHIFHDDLR